MTARRAYVALGANLGNPVEALQSAVNAVKALEGVAATGVSRLYRTSPVDSSGPDYVNGVLAVTFEGSPEAFLRSLQAIEAAHGRVRPTGVKNAPRTLDLDLLTVEGVTQTDAFLTLPHPRMEERLFVLVPLRDLDPAWRSPEGEGIDALIARVRSLDPSQIFVRKDEELLI